MSAMLNQLDYIMVSLRPRDDFMPIPSASDRNAWRMARYDSSAPVIERAQEYPGKAWADITVADRLLAAGGDSAPFMRKYSARRGALLTLSLAEALEGEGRFMSTLLNLCWMLCEETAWSLPAPKRSGEDPVPDIEKPRLDIGAAKTGALLAATLHLHRAAINAISPQISRRIEREIVLRVIDPFVGGRAAFDAMSPLCVRDCLTALLFIERDDSYRWGGVKLALQLIDAYIDRLPQDGGLPGGIRQYCNNVSYAMDALSLIDSACRDGVSFFTSSQLARIAMYIVNSHINGETFISEGDNTPRPRLDPAQLYRFGELTHVDELKSLGAYLLQLGRGSYADQGDILRAAYSLLNENAILRHDARPVLPMDSFTPSAQLLCVRSRAGSTSDFYAYMSGGANAPGTQADAGNIALYLDGEPVLLDLGEIDSARQMSPEDREALWETQSQYHNLPVVNGCAQRMGEGFGSTDPLWDLRPERSRATFDLTHAWPEQARLLSWQRTLLLERGETPFVRVWEVARFDGDDNALEFNFITPYRPELFDDRMVLGNVCVKWDDCPPLHCELQALPPELSKSYDPDNVYAEWTRAVCGKELYRVALSLSGVPHNFSVSFTFTRYTPPEGSN